MRELDRWIEAGAVVRPHGIRGEVILDVKADLTSCFEAGVEVRALTEEGQETSLMIEEARGHQGRLIVRFKGTDTRSAADSLRGITIWLVREQVGALGEDRWFVQDLLGIDVRTDTGELLGRLEEVLNMPANDVYVVRGEGGEILLPATEEVILDVNVESGTMTVHLLEGLRREAR